VRLLHLTDAGITLLRDIDPSMRKAQLRMLAPLPPEQRLVFMDMLRTLLEANNVLSRAPSQA
jgi:DNA-binding MarR family transcriptional regulator